jgi:hypothetical protein
VGKGLEPCTKEVQHVRHDGIIFVDTPAFPDPEMRGTQREEIRKLEKKIEKWLEKRYIPRRLDYCQFSHNIVFVVSAANAPKSTGYSICIISRETA